MSRIIVSILSNHSVPNFLFLKEMAGQYDEYLFITTPEVDKLGREEQLLSALGVSPNRVGTILVDGNDYRSALSTIKNEWEERDGDKFIVNLTGGTKMMSLAVHDFFVHKDSTFYYVPINKNIYYDLSSGATTSLQYKISLKEYFTLYGIYFKSTNEKDFNHTEKDADFIFNKLRYNNYFYRNYIKEKEIQEPNERKYYTGEWFEQFSYYKLKKAFNLSEDEIALSLKIYRNDDEVNNDNELDVAFMWENSLHIVECKVSLTGNPERLPKDTVDEYLYKLAAITKDFGLQVKSYLFTGHNMNRFSPETKSSLGKRCRILNIEGIVRGNMFNDLHAALTTNKIQLRTI